MILTQKIVKELLDYDLKTGILSWKERNYKWFKGDKYPLERNMNSWNKRFSGKIKHLGYFENFEDAVKERKLAEHKYNFHPNHGI